MQVIIVSAGVIASRIASMLTKDGHDVTVIDQSEAALDSLSLNLDVKTIQGSGINPKILQEADIANTDIIVAATRNDELNVITCFIAKELGAKRTVARIQNPEYPGYFLVPTKSPNAPRRIVRPQKIGVDLLVNPEILAAQHILNTLSSLFIIPVESLADDLIQIGEFVVEREEIIGISIKHMDFAKPGKIVAIVRSAITSIPTVDDELQLGDHVYVVGSKNDLEVIGRMFSKPRKPTKNVMIAGGGNISFHVAQNLEEMDVHVKIIEPNKDRCIELSKKLAKTLVIQGEVTSKEYLRDEGVQSADAFIAAAERDELNILVSLIAKNVGAPRSLALVNRQEYISLAEAIGIDIVVSPLLLANNAFVRFIRKPRVMSAATLAGGEAEAVEIPVASGAPIDGQQLDKARLPENVIVAAIIRDGKVVIPKSDEFVKSGDRIILVGFQTALAAAQKLFENK